MVLQYFPPLTGYRVVPLPRSAEPVVAGSAADLRAYFTLFTLLPEKHLPSGDHLRFQATVDLNVTTFHSLGRVSSGSMLRIGFPLVENEGPNLPGLSSVAIPSSELFSRVRNLPPLPKQLYTPDMAPDTTKYVSCSGEDLSNFQELAGDPPSLTPDGSWSWNGVSNVTVLAQDLAAVDDEQKHLFWSGILLGVAGGGVIALALELLGFRQALSDSRRRKGENKVAAHLTN
jgi:hypothetical protein